MFIINLSCAIPASPTEHDSDEGRIERFASQPAKMVCALEDIAASGVLKCAPRGISDANPSEGELGLRRPEAGCILSAA